MRVIADIETNGLEDCTKIWCIVCKETETGEVHVFRDPMGTPKPFLDFAQRVTCWVGHNFLLFDRLVIERLMGPLSVPKSTPLIAPQHVIDTLIISRLLDYNIPGGHSLDAWGHRLGIKKGTYDKWDEFTEEMLEYCIQDIEVTYQLYKHFLSYISSPRWSAALRLEHNIALVTHQMYVDGFAFDLPQAKVLYDTIKSQLDTLDLGIQLAFPPKSSLIREVTPKATKHNTISKVDFRWLPKDTSGNIDLSPFSIDAPFSQISFEPFNPASPKQIVERLNEAGWKPYVKTKGHVQAEKDNNQEKLDHYATYGWKVCEENLETLPPDAPEGARKLADRLVLESRRSDLEEWINACRPSVWDDKGNPIEWRVHGKTNHIGAWTHRLSHYAPNLANIAGIKKDSFKNTLMGWEGRYGYEFRGLWKAAKGKVLVGVDAKSVQLRVLAHYINDTAFTQAMVSGEEADGTDPHSLNQRALGSVCSTRAVAKTFIYAWLLGAGIGKVATVLSCTFLEAKRAVESFIAFYPGLKKLKQSDIPRDGVLGYFKGIDGRYVKVDSEYHVLAGYLQNGESTLLKTACLLWQKELDSRSIPYKLIAWPHDEWQTEVNPEHAELVGDIQSRSITAAGEILNLRCPMGGNFKVGNTWADTH